MKVKLIIFAIAICIISIVLFGPGLLWQKYDHQGLGFSILLPRVWAKIEGFSGTVILAKSPREGGDDMFQENINVVVVSAPQEMQPDTFFEMFKNETLKTVPGNEYDIEEGAMKAGPDLGRYLIFSSDGEHMSIRTLVGVWVKNGMAYIITCTSQDIAYSEYRSVFKHAMRSLRIK
ncbi:PsbP-related protein [Candidatus Omnitrophota bacterium]